MGDTNVFPSGMSEAARIAAQASQAAQNDQNTVSRDAQSRGAGGRRVAPRPAPRGRHGAPPPVGDPRSSGARRESNRATHGVPNPTPRIDAGRQVGIGGLTPAQRRELEEKMRPAPEQPLQQPQGGIPE